MARPANTAEANDIMRNRLAEGALELFREYGGDGVSLRKLAGYTGVSHTLLYRYFDNKEGLFTAVRLASLNLFYDMLCQVDSKTTAPLDRIRKAADALMTYGRQYPLEYRLVFSADQPKLVGKKALLELRHKVFDHIVSIAEEAKACGIIKLEARTWVHLIWATLHGILLLSDNNQLQEGRTVDDLVDSALSLFLPEVSLPGFNSVQNS